MAPTFPLTTSAWIPVYDLDADGWREVGMTEALTRAHRLVLPLVNSWDVPLLLVLAAAYDAACGPRTRTEWDDAWHAEALDAAKITAYLATWEHRLDLLDPVAPAFQCGDLTAINRGVRHLQPEMLGGASTTAHFHPRLDRGEDLAPCSAAEAARLLLHLLAYDIAGIRPAAPGDPAGRGGRSFGGQLSPVASAVHLHVMGGTTLKDLLLLNIPPRTPARGDAPVWEQELPPARRRTRPAAGRMDLWTWTARRTRLRATEHGTVDSLAFYDGDRLTGGWDTVAERDPMTLWAANTKRWAPYAYVGRDGKPASQPAPWSAARLLDGGGHSAALDHALAVCARGLLPASTPVSIALCTPTYTNIHKSNVRTLEVIPLELGTAAQLADPEIRRHLARLSRLADKPAAQLRRAIRIAGLENAPAAALRAEQVFTGTDIDSAWMDVVEDSQPEAHLEGIATWWEMQLDDALQRRIERLPTPAYAKTRHALRDLQQEQTRTLRAPRSGVARYVFDARERSLYQISQHHQCVVSYNTLNTRVQAGWNVHTAATTPTRPGRPNKTQDDAE